MEEKEKETWAEFEARMEATYGPQPSLREVYEQRLREQHERKLAQQELEEHQRRRRERLRRFSLGLLGRD
jgi:hypothetical protein